MRKASPSPKYAVSSPSVDLRLIRLWAQEDAAAECRSREHVRSMQIKAAEKRATEKARENLEVQKKEWLMELARREAESLQLPRRILMWNENAARGSISLEALQSILSIQSQMFAAFQALVDKKIPLLAPGARISAAEENRVLQEMFPRRRSNSTIPNMFSKKHVSFNSENTVIVYSRSSTPSLRR